MDGYALAREARTRWPDMPVIAATASVTLEERERCEQAGVTKPLSLARLCAALAQVTGQTTAAAWTETEATTRDDRSIGAGDADDGLLGERALPPAVRQSFLDSFDASLTALAATRRDNDTTRMLAELHSLRGALRVFDAEELDEPCARLQSTVREQGVAAAADLLDTFDIQVQATMLRHAQSAREALSMILANARRAAPEHAANRLLPALEAVLHKPVVDAN
ncbi:Hpt domain-containing protein [Paraburkholderia sp.]|uniref:Hpt domain-containing response regulator n=1 Tax=Paraburkholderia sp. TaxID=1926495 RepID=UPI0039E33BC3